MSRWTVSAGLIVGVVLVFALLAYLIYALINAEAF
ncbi:K(+)-transporting ATPase subunit F [Buttiauxella noackiae]